MNNPQLVIIVGLPASGKSRRLDEVWLELNGTPGCTHGDWAGWHPNRVAERQSLFAQLRAGFNVAIESSGFCNSEHLKRFLSEIPGVAYRVEFFDNDPLSCIRLALDDGRKPYDANGALARISQILRDCDDYEPDRQIGIVHRVHGSSELVLYQRAKSAELDCAIAWVNRILIRDGRRLAACDFTLMSRSHQSALTAHVRQLMYG